MQTLLTLDFASVIVCFLPSFAKAVCLLIYGAGVSGWEEGGDYQSPQSITRITMIAPKVLYMR